MNKLYTYNKSKSRMIINTNYKEFQRQTTYIGSGAVLSSTQRSDFIRPKICVRIPGDNHNTFTPGQLREFDLKPFNARSKKLVERFLLTPVTLYEFKIVTKDKKVRWLFSFVTDRKGNGLESDYNGTAKAFNAMQVVIGIIREQELKSCQV